jgi:antirestriction protein
MSEKQPQQEPEPNEPEGRDAHLKDVPRIWVGSLADYNNGRLHGEWIDAAVSADELAAAVQRMLASSEEPGAEEYGIFDYENFDGFRVHEYDRLDRVARVARGIAEHGPPFAAWAELHDGDESMLDQFEDAYHGEYDSPSEWARDVLEISGLQKAIDRVVPEGLRPYVQVDCDMWARDASLAGDIHVASNPAGGVWIFWAH